MCSRMKWHCFSHQLQLQHTDHMKIFYAVQATGNGHISRANAILPLLQKYGEVDVFLSGTNSGLKTALPVAYRSKGISLQYDLTSGGVDVRKTMASFRLRKLWSEAKYLPVEKYDLVINDFECITSLACKLKGIRSVHFGHQASFASKKVPRPEKINRIGEWVLANYAGGSRSVGLHFKQYDAHVFSPIIKPSILHADPVDGGHVSVYLGQYSDDIIMQQLLKLKKTRFHLFSRTAENISQVDHVTIMPISQSLFDNSLINCHGIITGAGFETPSEALYLGKKLMVMPMKGQYEQLCNAAALKDFNVCVVTTMDDYFPTWFNKWMFESAPTERLELSNPVQSIIGEVVHPATAYPPSNEMEDFTAIDPTPFLV